MVFFFSLVNTLWTMPVVLIIRKKVFVNKYKFEIFSQLNRARRISNGKSHPY
jgi:hypothetical protein